MTENAIDILNKISIMKILLITFIAMFMTHSAFADCEDSGIRVFPHTNILGINSIIILEGYAESQKTILELNRHCPAYLQSGKKKIKLIVKNIYVGQHELTQALLSPETELEKGIEYTLCVDSLPYNKPLMRYNYETNKRELITYKAMTNIDTISPILLSKPKVIKKILNFYGCGDEDFVVFNFPVKDSSDVIIKTILIDLETGKSTEYYLEPIKNQIYVGHDMCSGAFDYGNSSKYEVEFSFMDTSGNISLWNDERIKFTKPTNNLRH